MSIQIVQLRRFALTPSVLVEFIMVSMYIPPSVIRNLVRFHSEGCVVELVEEEFKGQMIRRWIADNKLVLHSEYIKPDNTNRK